MHSFFAQHRRKIRETVTALKLKKNKLHGGWVDITVEQRPRDLLVNNKRKEKVLHLRKFTIFDVGGGGDSQRPTPRAFVQIGVSQTEAAVHQL